MINIDFTTSTSNHKNLKLSAIFMADNFVYCLMDEEFRVILHKSQCKHSEFAQIVDKYTPAKIFITSKSKHFGHFADLDRIPRPNENHKIDKFTGTDAYCLYDATFLPLNFDARHFSVLLHHYHFLHKDTVMALHFDKDQVHFYVTKLGQLVLYNVYPFESQDDLLYYHALVTQQLGIDTQNQPLLLSGLIEEKSIAYTQLAYYHNNIQFAKSPLKLDLYDGDNDLLKGYHYFDHYLNVTCGL